mmetsp:Transcript_27728/g.48279  ORF Transcript_27728/g.48279 Transcript_27728/m.48279 type:complete len:140 (+) Transcript_27728:86-505(+)
MTLPLALPPTDSQRLALRRALHKARSSLPNHNPQPNSAVMEIFKPGDMLAPAIAHHDAERPLYVLSLESAHPLVLGQKVRAAQAGGFEADMHIEVPRRSLTVLRGNAADVAKHAVPSVRRSLVRVTLRRIRVSSEQMSE